MCWTSTAESSTLLEALSAFLSAQVSYSWSGTAIYTSFGRSSYRHRGAHTNPPNKEIN